MDNNGCLEALFGLIFGIAISIAFGFIFSLPVMWLWNWLMPLIFGLKTLTWTEAFGLSLLCGFLFKGSSTNVNKNK